MSFRRCLAFFIILASWPAQALEWEIERNFRYFAYPSDVAVQRVARDLYVSKNSKTQTRPLGSVVSTRTFCFTLNAVAAARRRRRRSRNSSSP
jgi:hypothetical protein